MRYFPLTKDRFEHQFGVRALAPSESIVEATDHYSEEILLRREALVRDCDYYFQAVADSTVAQHQARDLIIDSAPFLHGKINAKTGETIDLDHLQPLLEISRHVQEDLAIMSGDPDRGFPLIAAAIIFPSGWCVGDKLGQSVLTIHTPVPEFEDELNQATQQLMARLKPQRPVWRTNWAVRPSGQLDQSPIHGDKLRQRRAAITAENAGSECYFRVERQTLSRLPGGDILFTIHTHQSPLGGLSDEERKILLGVIETCPAETLKYKGIWPMRETVVQYLRKNIS